MSKAIRFISIILVLLGLTGCASPPAAPNSEIQPVATTEVINTESPAITEVVAQTEEPVSPDRQYTIGMMTIVSHPSLDAIQQGVKDALMEEGFEEGQNLEFILGNAEGDIATLSTIAQQFVDEKVDLIVAVSTPAMQAAFNATKDLQSPPVFFAGVSNPFVAGVATSYEDHPAWVIGSQLLDPVAETMELLLELKPDIKSIGLVYNPAEANAVYLVDIAQKEAGARGVTLELATVTNSSEVQVAAETLVGRGIGGFLAINENTVISAFEALVQVANDNDLVLVGTSASMPPRGATASYGINPREEGLDAGRLVAQYLKGEMDIATTSIPVQDAILLTVNPKAAEEQGIQLPPALLEEADNVIE